MKQTELMYEGKAKKVFATDDPKYVIVEYKDDATAFNGLKKGTITGKGIVNNRMSNHMRRQGYPLTSSRSFRKEEPSLSA